MKYYDILIRTANSAIKEIESKSFFVGGNNGPRNQKETPVRKVSHWLVVFCKLYKKTSNKKYSKFAVILKDYLMSKKSRPYGYTFYHRDFSNGDSCNGVIGQAWTLEALIWYYDTFKDVDVRILINKIIEFHSFDKKLGIWNRMDINGSKKRGFDTTLNHQIMFAGVLALGASFNAINNSNQVQIFLDRLKNNIELHTNGRFKMRINKYNMLKNLRIINFIRLTKTYSFFRRLLLFDKKYLIKARELEKNEKEIEIGYHAFHQYGLSYLYKFNPSHEIWDNKKIKKALLYSLSKDYIDDVFKNKYGYGYNPPGIEISFIIETFNNFLVKNSLEKKSFIELNVKKLLKKQMLLTFDFSKSLMNINEYDKITYSSRIYEMCYISENILNSTY